MADISLIATGRLLYFAKRSAALATLHINNDITMNEFFEAKQSMRRLIERNSELPLNASEEVDGNR